MRSAPPQPGRAKARQAEKEKLKDATDAAEEVREGDQGVGPPSGSRKGDGHDQRPGPADRPTAAGTGRGGEDQAATHQLEKIAQRAGRQAGPGRCQRGDFKKAADEMQKLQDQLAGKKLDDASKQKLAGQLQQMKDKLKQMADAAKAAQARPATSRSTSCGRTVKQGEADKLAEQLDKMQQQAPQMQQMQQLAQEVVEMLQVPAARRPGGKAAKAMGQLQADLKRAARSSWTSCRRSTGPWSNWPSARQAMTCPKCGGAGCEQCQGQGFCPGQGIGERPKGRNPASASAPAGGKAARPEAKTDTAMFDSRVRQQVARAPARWSARLPADPTSRGKWRRNSSSSSTPPATAPPIRSAAARLPRKHSEQAAGIFRPLPGGEVDGGGLGFGPWHSGSRGTAAWRERSVAFTSLVTPERTRFPRGTLHLATHLGT